MITSHILKTAYCTFRIFRTLTKKSPAHEGDGYFVLSPDLLPLGSDAILTVEDNDVPLRNPASITIDLHDRSYQY